MVGLIQGPLCFLMFFVFTQDLLRLAALEWLSCS